MVYPQRGDPERGGRRPHQCLEKCRSLFPVRDPYDFQKIRLMPGLPGSCEKGREETAAYPTDVPFPGRNPFQLPFSSAEKGCGTSERGTNLSIGGTGNGDFLPIRPSAHQAGYGTFRVLFQPYWTDPPIYCPISSRTGTQAGPQTYKARKNVGRIQQDLPGTADPICLYTILKRRDLIIMGFTCTVCQRSYTIHRKNHICPACNSLIRQMSKMIPYKERAEILRQQVRYGIFGTFPKARTVSLKDTLQIKACTHCVWNRSTNRDGLSVRCSLPTCAKAWGKQWRPYT